MEMAIPRSRTTSRDGWHQFEDMLDTIDRHLSIELIGPEQSGKTYIALTAPGPIAYFDMDDNDRPVVRKIREKWPDKVIKKMSFEIPKGLVVNEKLQKMAIAERNRYLDAWTWACESDKVKTLVMDTGTDAWELWRYAEFGAESSRARNYGGLNSQFAAMLRMPRRHGKNLAVINRTKDQWKDDKPTGAIIRDGFKNTGYAMHATIEAMRDEYDNFSIQLRDVRHDASLNGAIFGPDGLGGEISWAMVACQIVEGSTPDEWE